MRYWACSLSISAYGVGTLVFVLLLGCRISSNWSEFKSIEMNREGYLSPWTTCQWMADGKQVHCVTAKSISNQLYLSGKLGNITIALQTCFLLAGLVEIVLLTQHKEHSWKYRASTVSKVIYAAAATITSLLAVYLYLRSIEALVTYTHQHSSPYYLWWHMVFLSMFSFALSCVHCWVVYRNHQQHQFARTTATLTTEEVPLQTATTGGEQKVIPRRNVPPNVTFQPGMAEVQPSTSRGTTYQPSHRGMPLRSALAGRGNARTHKARKLVVRFEVIPKETASIATSSD